ncbi:MAG: fluoride efflux transporter CrcB [Actinomycetota bacterium]|jgi:CrcB protein
MNLQLMLLVGLVGGGASVIRFLFSLMPGKFPVGILIANTLASFIGGIASSGLAIDPTLGLILVSGLAGGLSTFSTFAAQTSTLISQKQPKLAWLNVALNFGTTITAATLGTNLGLALLK